MNEPLLRIVISQIWQIAALTIVVALIVRIVARNRPHLAHALWIPVLIKCVTRPLLGHSPGVFSQIQALAAPREVATGIEDANLRIDTIEVDALANQRLKFRPLSLRQRDILPNGHDCWRSHGQHSKSDSQTD